MRKHNHNERSNKAMRKSLLAIALMTLLTAGPVTAQIFLDDESLSQRGWLGTMDELGNIIPFHEVDWDQANYAPTGGGILLLGLLGGTYLVGKKRKEE